MRFPFYSVLVFLLTVTGLTAQTGTVAIDESTLPVSFFDHLYADNDEPLVMTLRTDMKRLVARKDREEYQPAVLTYRSPDGGEVTYEIKIRARGNIRKVVCFYPPIRLKFRKDDLEKAGLAQEYNKIKMVVQCKAFSPSDIYVWKEYLAYRLYNLLSPYSFRVRAVQLTLVDSREKAKDRPMAAFLIEPEEELAERFAGVPLERTKCLTSMLTREPYLKVAVFQYMIGNTDWQAYNIHNLQLLKVPEYDRMITVPYDFDYSGFVNTFYAVPHESLPIKTVRQRLYRGLTCTEEETLMLRQYFKDHEDAIMTYCREFQLLDENTREDVIDYLAEFFQLLDKEKNLQYIFTE